LFPLLALPKIEQGKKGLLSSSAYIEMMIKRAKMEEKMANHQPKVVQINTPVDQPVDIEISTIPDLGIATSTPTTPSQASSGDAEVAPGGRKPPIWERILGWFTGMLKSIFKRPKKTVSRKTTTSAIPQTEVPGGIIGGIIMIVAGIFATTMKIKLVAAVALVAFALGVVTGGLFFFAVQAVQAWLIATFGGG